MVIESIRTNISALQIIGRLNNTDNRIATNLERISSGLRIKSAKDDPGGYILSNQLETQFRGLSRASENTQEAINLTATASSATDQIVSLLNDIRVAAVAAAGGSGAQQAVIQEKIEALNEIANTTKFGNKFLLNGSLTTDVNFKSGTRDFGASLSFGPNATSLLSGRSYLNIGVTDSGTTEIKDAGDGTFHTGISAATDIAVSTGQLINGGIAAVGGNNLAATSMNRVTLNSMDYITFSGVLADGTTFFSGTLSVMAGNTVTTLINTIQASINAAENDIGIEGTGVLETNVALTANGRLEFNSGTDQNISEFDIDFAVRNSAGTIRTTFDIDRATNIYNQEVGGTISEALIGNSVTAITGSTFDSGTFDITVSNIIAEQRRQITTSNNFDRNGGGPVFNTTSLSDSLLNGVSIVMGSTFQINGTESDGSTFTTTYTVGFDTGVGDGIIETYSGLIKELNNRDQSLTSRGFNGAIATLTGAGEIQLIDDIGKDSTTNLQIIVSAGGQTVNSTVDAAGSREKATVSIDGGAAQQVDAGQVVTLEGVNLSGGPNPEVTIRLGTGLAAGDDQLETSAKEFVGSLNGGEIVTFQNGDQAVQFTAGQASIYPIKKFQQVTLDFDSILDATTLASSGGETFVLSTTSNAVNFQIGKDSNSQKLFIFADLRSENLGSNSTNNLDSINVTTASGATAALTIIDDALEQVNGFSARLGAFASRLDDAIETLDLASLDIENAHTSIVSADIAQETTELALNTVMLQAQSAVLAQANSMPQAVLQILLDLP